MEEENRYLKTEEAASYLKDRWGLTVQPSTLTRQRTQGGGPIYTRSGRTPLYLTTDLDDWALARPKYEATYRETEHAHGFPPSC